MARTITKKAENDKRNKAVTAGNTPAVSKTGTYLLIAAIACVVAVSLWLRLKAFPIFSVDSLMVLTGDADSPSHLRFFDYTIKHFPKMHPPVDYYANYPWGFALDSPPIWAYTLALAAFPIWKLLGSSPQQIAGVLTLLMGIAAAIPLYFLAKELFGKRVGLASAVISLVFPFYIIMTVSAVDHITADVILLPSIFALFFIAARKFDLDKKSFLVSAGLSGILTALAMLMSMSLILLLAMMLLPAVLGIFLLRKADLRPYMATFGVQYGVAALAFLVLALLTPWFSNALEFKHLSFLHILVFTSISAFGGTNYLLTGSSVKQSYYRIVAAAAIVLSALVIVLVPDLRDLVSNAYYRSIGSYPLGRNTNELIPVVERGLSWVTQYYSHLIFVAPIPVVFLLFKDIKRRSVSFQNLFFYSMLLGLGFYTFNAFYYFSPYFSIFLAISYGMLAAIIADFIIRASKLNNASLEKPGSDNIIATAAVVAAFIMVMTITGANILPRETSANLVDVAMFLKNETKPAGDFYNPAVKPAYSVLAYWGDSFTLEYLSQRPMLASGNHESGIKGIIASEQFWQATTEEEALAILDGLGVKYVIAGGPYSIWAGDITRIGEAVPDPDLVARPLADSELTGDMVQEAMATRLVMGVMYPQAAQKYDLLNNFRLRYISYVERAKPPYMLFEVVAGARVTVKAEPFSNVSITTNATLKAMGDRQVQIWSAYGETDEAGLYTATVPYATGSDSGIQIEPFVVKSTYLQQELRINDKTVKNGESITVDLRKPGIFADWGPAE